MPKAPHLIVVSNRLPVVCEREGEAWTTRPASGGLVTAVTPVLQQRGGTWVGWGGTLKEDDVNVAELLAGEGRRDGYDLAPVVLTRDERDKFYNGFSNEIIWPLFHSLGERCNFDPAYWEAYETVNWRFARAAHDVIPTDDSFVWVHDYHLMLLGEQLRSLGVSDPIGFFLHIPFPAPDIYLKLPWRFELLRGLLSFDTVGFQTLRDRRNFIQCARILQPEATVTGRGRVQTITTRSHAVRVGTFPISIDYEDFATRAATPAVCSRVESVENELEDRKILLGIDRLDYTKGIPTRLKAFRRVLQLHPHLRRKVRLVQIVVPSRVMIPSYQRLKEEIDELVGEINGRYTEAGWVPVHYSFRSVEPDELLAYYRVAAVALVTPLNDGMNLVAKEYCASNIHERGVLILSEFAGAAAELRPDALLVNPYDIVGMADAIVEALGMPLDERKARMQRLRRTIQRNDIGRWLHQYLAAAITGTRDDAEPVEFYVPSQTSHTPTRSKPSKFVLTAAQSARPAAVRRIGPGQRYEENAADATSDGA